MADANTLSVFVTALNEQANLEMAVAVVVAAAEQGFDDYEIFVFNDGSTDRTGEIADALAAGNPRVAAIHHRRPMNVGGCIREGLARARMHWSIQVDGKGATTREALDRIFALRRQADLVIPYTLNTDQRHRMRRIISRTYLMLVNTLFGLKMHYYGTGALMLTALAQQFTIRTSSYAFNAEMIIKMVRNGCSYVEVGIEDRFDNTGRRSKAFSWRNIKGVCAFVGRTFWDVYVARDYRRRTNEAPPAAAQE
ncbi:MAG: glycosyltransferase family 2 protein [Planctomycetaceae bacterium]|nr:glycosyltransferase family 2 protein [Planctomycetaceae bacterium]